MAENSGYQELKPLPHRSKQSESYQQKLAEKAIRREVRKEIAHAYALGKKHKMHESSHQKPQTPGLWGKLRSILDSK